MSWKLRLIEPPHLGIGLLKKISSACSRNWRIQSGSFFMSEIWLTISASRPLRARNTGLASVRKSYLLISPTGSARVGFKISVAMTGLNFLCDRGFFFFHHLPVHLLGLRIGPADPIITLTVQFVGQFNAARLNDPAAQDHVGEIGRVMLQQLVVVRDDQKAHLVAANFGDRL